MVLLLQSGAEVDATTKDLYTALHIAAKEGQEEVASVLLEHKASLTAATKKGFTPLHLAAKYGNLKVSRLLLEKDAPVDAEGNFTTRMRAKRASEFRFLRIYYFSINSSTFW